MSSGTVGSLFSGIGGIDLGLERAGLRVIWQSELDPYASKVLAKHWPTVPNLGDIKQIDWSTVERPDVIAGGFPCQPVSQAGKQRAQEDPRWLWPEFARCLRHLRPRYALLENVPALLTVAGGAAAQEVFGDLALLGYDAEWCRLAASDFGAPHIRKRVFVVAYTQRQGVRPCLPGQLEGAPGTGAGQGTQRQRVRPDPVDGGAGTGDVAHTHGAGLGEQWWPGPVFEEHSAPERSGWWSVEPDVGRMVDGFPGRVDRLRCLGNAVVPQVAEYVGHAIMDHMCRDIEDRLVG